MCCDQEDIEICHDVSVFYAFEIEGDTPKGMSPSGDEAGFDG